MIAMAVVLTVLVNPRPEGYGSRLVINPRHEGLR